VRRSRGCQKKRPGGEKATGGHGKRGEGGRNENVAGFTRGGAKRKTPLLGKRTTFKKQGGEIAKLGRKKKTQKKRRGLRGRRDGGRGYGTQKGGGNKQKEKSKLVRTVQKWGKRRSS